jgi:hypothetical protein
MLLFFNLIIILVLAANACAIVAFTLYFTCSIHQNKHLK